MWVRKGSILCEINRTQIQLCIRQHIDAFLPKWVPFPAHNEPWAPKFSPSFSQKKKKLENYYRKEHRRTYYTIHRITWKRQNRQGEVVSSFSIWNRSRCLTDKRVEGLVSINCEEEMAESDTLLKIAIFLIRFRQTIQGKLTWIEKWFLAKDSTRSKI